MALYAATATSTEYTTAALAAAGLETLLEAAATTVFIRACGIIKGDREHSYFAYLVTSDATV